MKIKVQRQLTAALENAPGRLADICQILSDHGINIEAISVVDNVEQSVIRFLTSNPVESKRLLQEEHIYVIEADVLTVELTDQRGKLARISASLAAENVNIDYLYGSFHHIGARTKIVLKVSDLAKAQEILGPLEVS